MTPTLTKHPKENSFTFSQIHPNIKVLLQLVRNFIVLKIL